MADYALVIGINHYVPPEAGGLRELKGAIRDATDFHAWVCSADGGKIPAANAHLVTSSAQPLHPEHLQIDEKLELIIDSLGNDQGDRFYFYFAGHGLSIEKEPDEVALCLGRWSESKRNYALSFEQYKKLLTVCRYFKETIFLLDCCRTEMLHVKPLHSTLTERDQTNRVATRSFVAYATQDNAESFEAGNGLETRGVFTEVLLTGLKGAAANEQGNVDATRLHKYLNFNVPIFAKNRGFSQRPEVRHGFMDNELVFTSFGNRNAEVPCQITIGSGRTGSIELYDHNADVIAVIDTAVQRSVTIPLKPATYVLLEKNTMRSLTFDVTHSNPVQHVSF